MRHVPGPDGSALAVHHLGGGPAPRLLCHATGFHGLVWEPYAKALGRRASTAGRWTSAAHGASVVPDGEVPPLGGLPRRRPRRDRRARPAARRAARRSATRWAAARCSSPSRPARGRSPACGCSSRSPRRRGLGSAEAPPDEPAAAEPLGRRRRPPPAHVRVRDADAWPTSPASHRSTASGPTPSRPTSATASCPTTPRAPPRGPCAWPAGRATSRSSTGARRPTRRSRASPRWRAPSMVASGDEAGPSLFAPAIVDVLPNARLVPFDQLGHFGPLEAPERVAAATMALRRRALTDPRRPSRGASHPVRTLCPWPFRCPRASRRPR